MQSDDVWMEMQGLMNVNLKNDDDDDYQLRKDCGLPLTFERPERLDPSQL
jgi:hypothetical protein